MCLHFGNHSKKSGMRSKQKNIDRDCQRAENLVKTKSFKRLSWLTAMIAVLGLSMASLFLYYL